VSDTVVLDSSAIVALLVDGGETGDWVASAVRKGWLAAPESAMFETANVLRRQQLTGRLERVEATLAHQELLSLPLQLWPYLTLADRAWELRDSVTSYDGSYVALAEMLGAPLITLDHKLQRASGPNCTILTPPSV
jgi:predicted nucleic acid-binding protein